MTENPADEYAQKLHNIIGEYAKTQELERAQMALLKIEIIRLRKLIELVGQGIEQNIGIIALREELADE